MVSSHSIAMVEKNAKAPLLKEIERLRELIGPDEIKYLAYSVDNMNLKDEIERLRAEVSRLAVENEGLKNVRKSLGKFERKIKTLEKFINDEHNAKIDKVLFPQG